MRSIHYTIATALGSGYSPFAPGTAGTVLALLIAILFFAGNFTVLVLSTAIAIAIGVVSANFVEKDLGSEDPQIVVIDEVAGMWISLLWVPAEPIWWHLLAFGFFRLFDIFKPWPVDAVQDIHGGWGIMLDDILAGIYALAATHLIIWGFTAIS